MNWNMIFRTAITFTTSVTVNNTVANIIKASTPKDLNLFNKVCVELGGFIISGMVSKKAVEYVNGEMDELFSSLSNKKELKEG